MSDQWSPLPIWLKVVLALLFGMMFGLAVVSAVVGEWPGAVLASAIVTTMAALFGPFSAVSQAVNLRMSDAQLMASGVVVLVGVWITRVVTTGDRSPVLAIGIAVSVAWLVKTVLHSGWSRRHD